MTSPKLYSRKEVITINRELANALIAAMDAKQITVECLAELCGVSRTTMSAYRSGGLPSDDTMLELMHHLDAPWLGWIWLRSNAVGAELLPEVQIRELSAGFCDLQVELDDNNALQMQMARICRDNRVTAEERLTWEHCLGQLRELMTSAISLLLTSAGKEKRPRQAA